MKINNISGSDPSFPQRLQDIPSAPKRLFIRGELPVYRRGIAIVGTRKPTAYGRQVTKELAGKLAEKGAVVISGLAHGIDSIAHQAVVDTGGTTIAVLPSGVDNVYPSSHQALSEQIINTGGALVSEYEPGTPALQFRFLERNRLVSGLADILIVTEAALRSGTTNTVRHALEQGRDVYAVPGPITSAMSAGCNQLITQGANPIVNLDAFVEQLFPKPSRKQATLLAQTTEEQMILELIAAGIADGEELHAKSGLDAAAFLQTITMLELRSVIRPLGANRWSL
jgi:DNA processing protein